MTSTATAGSDPVSDDLVHALFEKQARRTPHVIAVEAEGDAGGDAGGEQLTYAELDRRANQVAHHLRRAGVGPETTVGVCLERCVDLVVSILAILKAGGAYVPLEPDYPDGRLAGMIADARVETVLTHRRFTDRVPAARTLVCLDAQGSQIGRESGLAPRAALAPDNLAYVVFTSGSTGRPKGAMNTHRAICNRMRWVQEVYRLRGDDRVLQKTPIGFDVSIWEFLWPLLFGGRLVLARPGGHRDAAYLGRAIVAHGITVLHFVPSMLRAFLEEPGIEECRSVRRVICSGEALTPDLRDRFFSRLDAELHNLYGPTETAIEVSHWTCPRGDSRRAVPIGRPIAGVHLPVLDSRLVPAAPDEAGELFIGGVAVGRGYVGRAGLTAERFLPDPFGPPGSRFYRTGDLARCPADGEIEYLGRVDHQVKIRGHRVEPGEVAAALQEHPAVRQAAVVARRLASGELGLVAFVCLRERVAGPTPATAAAPAPASVSVPPAMAGELRVHLAARLPRTMVPAFYISLDSLPRGGSDKIDVRALEQRPIDWAAVGASRSIGSGDVADSGEQRTVAAVWQELLGVSGVGPADDFLALGGDSLTAGRVARALNRRLGSQLTIADTLRHTRLEDLAARLRADPRRLDEAAGEPIIRRLPRGGALPLSPAQEGLWFLEQVQPGVYNEVAAIDLSGPLDLECLRRALGALIERHEVLRSAFVAVDGAPSVHLLADAGEVLEVAEATDEAGLADHVRRLAGRAFDLERGRAIRFACVPLGPRRHVLLVCAHHMVCDGLSQEVLLADVAELYAAGAEGRAPRLAPLPVQVADHAAWQRGRLSEARREALLAHWRQALDGAPPALELPTDGPRAVAAARRGARHRFEIAPQLVAELRALARGQGATLFMTLLGLFQALLARHAGTRDVVIGTPVVMRDREELERLIGLFVNTLPVRLRLDRETSAAQVVQRGRRSVTDALAHRDLPFEDLVADLAPARDPGRHPVFQVTFVLDEPPARARAGDLELALTELASGAAKFDLSLLVRPRGERLEASFEYASSLFSAVAIEQLARHYTALLAAACRRPDAPVARLDLMADDERRALRDRMAGRPRPGRSSPPAAPFELQFVRQFERHVSRQPDRFAVVADGDGESLTYGELDRRSALLAGALRARGLGPDRLVAILSERSPMAIVAMLAALRAGGGYLPIDPRLPRERIALILREASPVALLCRRELRGAVPPQGPQIFGLDQEGERLETVAAPPGALAYVIYTSGSTGAPKGVVIARSGLDAQLGWLQDEYRLSPDDRFLQLASSMFDFSVVEVFWPLLAGGAVVLPRPGGELEPSYLAALVRRTATTAVHFVPSMLRALLDQAGRDDWRGITRLFSGGEALPADLSRRCREAFPDAELHNQYGPTETTVNASFCRVAPDSAVVPIGRAVADTTLHVLDPELQLAPPGVAGELFIGGVQLARGYLGRPGETAERFVPDPFAAAPGERLYRTGDRVRLGGHCVLEYLGRTDHQVKVRGFRVELGEIEAALRRNPGVRDAVCSVPAAGDAARIVAHVELRAGAAGGADAGWLEAHLRELLPEFMMPSAFVAVDRWPTTPTGKLDRAALPAPSLAPSLAPSFAGASRADEALTPTEQTVAAVLGELIGADIRSPEADFFQLGATSLLAMRAIGRLNRATGSDLSVLALLQARTVRRVAALIAARSPTRATAAAGGAFALPPLAARPDRTRWPLSFSQRMSWSLTHRGRQSAFEMPRRIFEVSGRLDRGALRRAVEAVVGRHAVLRARFARTGGALVQEVAAAPRHDWHELDVACPGRPGADGGARSRAVAQLTELFARPFDLELGPVIRFALTSASASTSAEASAERHWFGFAVHHIAFDGGSLEPLFADLGRAYRELAAGRAVSWCAPALEIADVAAWERSVWRTAGPVMAGYWREQLAGARPAALPMSDWSGDNDLCPRPAITSCFSLRGSVLERLRETASAMGSTPFVVAGASFGATWRALTGSHDVCLASPYMRRDLPGADAVVGHMTNPLLFRLDWPAAASFADAVAHTGERVFGAYRHGHLPLGHGPDVMPGLPAGEALASDQLYRVFFNYLDLSRAELDLGPGAMATPVDLASEPETRFPLMVFATETGDAVTWNLVAQARCYRPEQLSALAGRIATDLARAVGAATAAVDATAERHVDVRAR